MKDYIVKGILFVFLALCMLIFLVSIFYKPSLVKADSNNREIMESKMDTLIVDRIVRACNNQYEKLEDKEGRNINRCIKVSFAIACNESSCGKRYINNSIHGIQKSFETQLDAINYFTKTYYTYWYKGTEGAFFYGSENGPAPTRFCISEESSGSIGWCKNGRNHFNYFYNLLD